jgi:hypothetical protein
MLFIYNCSLDAILKSIIKRQIPFLIGGTITGIIMAYYYGFLFTIIVNSIMWYVISYLVSKYYYKTKGINDQKYLIRYVLSKIKSRNRHYSWVRKRHKIYSLLHYYCFEHFSLRWDIAFTNKLSPIFKYFSMNNRLLTTTKTSNLLP